MIILDIGTTAEVVFPSTCLLGETAGAAFETMLELPAQEKFL